MSASLAAFLATLIGAVSIVLGAWGVWLIVDPNELIHFEVAIPALVLAAVGFCTAAVLWLRSGR